MEISVIFLCLILSAFFSGMEIAFVSSNKIYLEIEKKQGGFVSRILTKLTEKPSKFIVAMLIGNNVTMVVYGFFMGELLMRWFVTLGLQFSDFLDLLIQTIISTIIVLITAEFLPKVFFQIYANFLFKFFAIPAYFFFSIFYFIAAFFIWVSDFVLIKFFKTEGDNVQLYFSKIELGNYITEQMSSVEDDDAMDSEILMFQNALEFSGVKARDVMNPRTEIIAIDLSDTIIDLRELFIETGYSKIVVFQNSLDDIVGYVHSFDMFKKPDSIKDIVIPVEFVPETIFIKDAMSLLIKKRKSVAIVLDEYGGTSGIITVEDIVEELFGEIEDEHDSDEELIEKELGDGEYVFSARLDVEYLNDTYKLAIPESDSYGTLGGFIVNFTTEIPQNGAVITIGAYRFVIEEAINKKIELVNMTVLE
ncbi:HlyC/CorC family transporter [Flavobacterium sp. GSP27]|uniref:HlyC/CorC family transporter n=1 Tax=Flavobacterium bomense TaxID=2497483 RepID=A0A432CLX9_9FLAO|nr:MULTISPECIES: hemolysin family protein [Flavobacterium]RTY93575.1 HlyC/CorC family transporter [Flavobacterium sp. GSN2]RTY65837.1 HlyC/CorC family transporter [Flavobacterium sp. LB2P53]RTY76014.1 HlyC/CorC family transporter [Flavobacterium sp. LS1R10]RTZ04347.1 HlyC/CorC family transporter [Flavobacterium bomense]RTZ04441.1 HlyC/CorC family transporter [Flavobacterium sp. GSP6]